MYGDHASSHSFAALLFSNFTYFASINTYGILIGRLSSPRLFYEIRCSPLAARRSTRRIHNTCHVFSRLFENPNHT